MLFKKNLILTHNFSIANDWNASLLKLAKVDMPLMLLLHCVMLHAFRMLTETYQSQNYFGKNQKNDLAINFITESTQRFNIVACR